MVDSRLRGNDDIFCSAASLKSEQGFTLLEVLLVLVLMGLAASVVVPTVGAGNSSQQLEKQARQFALQTEMVIRQAMMNGRHYGFRETEEGYRFVSWQSDQWLPVENDRFMQPVTLDESMQLEVRHGSSHWQAALEHESRDRPTLLEKDFAVIDKQERYEPELFFWSSGEISPADVVFCFDHNQQSCWLVTLEETGQLSVSRES